MPHDHRRRGRRRGWSRSAPQRDGLDAMLRFSDVSHRMMCSSSLRPGTGAAGVPRNAFGGDGFDLADDRADPPYWLVGATRRVAPTLSAGVPVAPPTGRPCLRRPPAQGMARVFVVFGPPRWVGRDVAVQRCFTPDDVFVIIAPRHGRRRRPAQCVDAFGCGRFNRADDGPQRTGDDVGGRRAAASAVILALMFCR